ncbi:MAG: hypothetical protein DRH10_00615 [Deltaproteobacteria bacterium]|nr:MAG: hypothetical protein DRH10_00615 [Deltaproteobacteria bacterium]
MKQDTGNIQGQKVDKGEIAIKKFANAIENAKKGRYDVIITVEVKCHNGGVAQVYSNIRKKEV